MIVSKNQLSLAGEFAVLSQLSLRGFDANLTLGNTKGVDILVSDPTTGLMSKVEVKTAPERITIEKLFGEGSFLFWVMTEKQESSLDSRLFYCFVSINEDSEFRYFLVPGAIVAKYLKDQHEFYMKNRKARAESSTSSMRKFRISLDDKSSFEMWTPSAKEYENNWSILRHQGS